MRCRLNRLCSISVRNLAVEHFRGKIRTLAERKIFIGTSSWRYEGWLNQIYTPERYMSRGRFSKRKFHEESIQEYAEMFPIVGGDFSFYSIPEPVFWRKLFSSTPPHLKWNLKVPEDFTAKRFSRQRRYGVRAGQENPAFLDAELFQSAFLEPLSAYLDRMGVFIMEFGTFSQASYAEPREFAEDLDAFLRRLPPQFQYAVEIRNDNFLDASYFDVLKSNRVAHIFASWSRMPSLRQQLLIDDAFSALLPLLGRLCVPAVRTRMPYRCSSPIAKCWKNTLRRAKRSETS